MNKISYMPQSKACLEACSTNVNIQVVTLTLCNTIAQIISSYRRPEPYEDTKRQVQCFIGRFRVTTLSGRQTKLSNVLAHGAQPSQRGFLYFPARHLINATPWYGQLLLLMLIISTSQEVTSTMSCRNTQRLAGSKKMQPSQIFGGYLRPTHPSSVEQFL